MAKYIDAKKFTALFKRRRKNHDAICADLYKMAQHISTLFDFAQLADREDAITSAAIRAIGKIPRFDAAKGDAFTYYTTVISNAMLRCLEKSRSVREVPLIEEFEKYLDITHKVGGVLITRHKPRMRDK